MVNETDSIACRYTAQIEQDGKRYIIEVPDAEIEFGSLSAGGAYQITVKHPNDQQQPETNNTSNESDSQNTNVQAPVSEGQKLDVTIEDVGQQGDGIARVGPGYVLIVPGSEVGDELTVEIQQITPSFGFAEILDHSEDSANDDEESPSDNEDVPDENVVSDGPSETDEKNTAAKSATSE